MRYDPNHDGCTLYSIITKRLQGSTVQEAQRGGRFRSFYILESYTRGLKKNKRINLHYSTLRCHGILLPRHPTAFRSRTEACNQLLLALGSVQLTQPEQGLSCVGCSGQPKAMDTSKLCRTLLDKAPWVSSGQKIFIYTNEVLCR